MDRSDQKMDADWKIAIVINNFNELAEISEKYSDYLDAIRSDDITTSDLMAIVFNMLYHKGEEFEEIDDVIDFGGLFGDDSRGGGTDWRNGWDDAVRDADGQLGEH